MSAKSTSLSLIVEERNHAEKFFQEMNQAIWNDFERHREGAYADHIAKSREMILDVAGCALPKRRIVVLGPGEIEPLEALSKLFEEIVVVDIVAESLDRLAVSSESNIQLVKADLSRGVVEQAVAFIAKMRLNLPSPSRFFEEATHFFTTCSVESSPLPDAAREADCIVSSFVITQLANQVQLYIERRYHELYEGMSDTECDAEPLFRAQEAFRLRMQQQHLEDVASLGRAESAVYLADACQGVRASEEVPNERSEHRFTMVTDNLFETLPRHFTDIARSSWEWPSVPSGSFSNSPTMSITFTIFCCTMKVASS